MKKINKKNPLLALAMMVSCVQGHASGGADAPQDRRSGEAATLILCVRESRGGCH